VLRHPVDGSLASSAPKTVQKEIPAVMGLPALSR